MRRIALTAFVLLLAIAPAAWAGGIVLALSDDRGPYAEFSAALDEGLDGTAWRVIRRVPAGAGGLPTVGADLIVTAGSDALRQTLASGTTIPILATLLPRQSYERIIAESGRLRGRLTAITLDQPPARQARFLRHLLPGQKRVGMLLGEETQGQAAQYQQALTAAGLSLDSEVADDSDSGLLAAANLLLPRVNVLLAIPDSTIYKRDNIKAILVTSYRHQRPVVAWSAAFVKAGALAALYSTPAQIARQSADLITSAGPLPAGPLAPALFAVSINHNVAQALRLAVPDEVSIRQAMLADRESR